MKRVQKGLVVGMLCVSLTATGISLNGIATGWKQDLAMAEVTEGFNVWYGGDIITNQNITMLVGEQIILSSEIKEKVEWTATDAKVVNVLAESGLVTGMQEGTTTVTVRNDSGQTASIQITVVNEPVVSGNFKYVKMTDTTAKIVEYTGTKEKKVTVPATLDGLQVTHIGYALFGGHTEIESVVFEYGIRSIGEYALARTGTKQVTFPASISSISKNCFEQAGVGMIYCTEGSVAEKFCSDNKMIYKSTPLLEGETLGQPITQVNSSLETLTPASAESSVIVLTNANFEEQVHQTKGKLVIDVSTTWCNPCQRMKPNYDQLAKVYSGQVRFASLDGDAYVSLITDRTSDGKNPVQGYPTLLFYEDGKLISNKTGYMDYNTLETTICTTFKIAQQTASSEGTENSGVNNTQTATNGAITTDAPQTTDKPSVTDAPKPSNEKVSVAKAKIKKVVRVSKSKMKVTVKKVSKANGYKIVYADNSKFKKQNTVFTSSTSKTITGLKKRKSYYVKVYAYRLDSQGKKIYGKPSNVKEVK